MSDKHDPDELDLFEAGRLLGLGRKRLIKWSKDGRLPHRRDGFAWFFWREDLIAFARQHCLECGQHHLQISPGVYFCTACASAHSLDNTDVDLPFLERMEQQRIQLFCMRLADQACSEDEAISRLQERLSSSLLRAYQVWYANHHQKEGTLRIGLGSIDSPFPDDETA